MPAGVRLTASISSGMAWLREASCSSSAVSGTSAAAPEPACGLGRGFMYPGLGAAGAVSGTWVPDGQLGQPAGLDDDDLVPLGADHPGFAQFAQDAHHHLAYRTD